MTADFDIILLLISWPTIPKDKLTRNGPHLYIYNSIKSNMHLERFVDIAALKLDKIILFFDVFVRRIFI